MGAEERAWVVVVQEYGESETSSSCRGPTRLAAAGSVCLSDEAAASAGAAVSRTAQVVAQASGLAQSKKPGHHGGRASQPPSPKLAAHDFTQ